MKTPPSFWGEGVFWKGMRFEKTLSKQHDKGFLQPPGIFCFRSPEGSSRTRNPEGQPSLHRC